jgi:hypothetical protein
MWRKFLFWNTLYNLNLPQSFQFSPTSLSMLISRDGILEVQHLDGPPTDPPTQASRHYDKISTNGTYVVIVPMYGQTITITNLHNNSSQLIDLGYGILCGLALTGNILLVERANELDG